MRLHSGSCLLTDAEDAGCFQFDSASFCSSFSELSKLKRGVCLEHYRILELSVRHDSATVHIRRSTARSTL